MGLTNYPFASADEITDVEAKGLIAELREKGKSEEEILKTLLAGTREHTRILLPWNQYPAEFREEMRQPINQKITDVYKELIALRKQDKTLIYGDFKVLDDSKDKFTYSRSLNGTTYIVDCNLSKQEKKAYSHTEGLQFVFASTGKEELSKTLTPYEVRIFVEK